MEGLMNTNIIRYIAISSHNEGQVRIWSHSTHILTGVMTQTFVRLQQLHAYRKIILIRMEEDKSIR